MKGHDEYFSVPVLDRLVSISNGLVPVPLKDREKRCKINKNKIFGYVSFFNRIKVFF